MNLSLVWSIIKKLTTKEAPKSTSRIRLFGRTWVIRRRVFGAGLLVLAGYLGSHYGFILNGNAQDIIVNNLQVIITTVSAAISTPWDFAHIGDKLNNLQSLITALIGIYGSIKGIHGIIDRQKPITATQGQTAPPSMQPVPPPSKEETPYKVEPKEEDKSDPSDTGNIAQ